MNTIRKSIRSIFSGHQAPQAEAPQKARYSVDSGRVLKDFDSDLEVQISALAQIRGEAKMLPALEAELLSLFPEFEYIIKEFIKYYGEYCKTGVPSESAYLNWRHLFFQTKGVSNQVIQRHLSADSHQPEVPEMVKSLYGDFTAEDIRQAAITMDRDGVFQFPNPLPREFLDKLIDQLDEEAAQNNGLLDMSSATDCRIFLKRPLLYRNENIRKLASDPYAYYICSEYFDMPPILNSINSWTTRPHANSDDVISGSAQAFHIDMSNYKFVQMFIYLKDVTEANGPHCFIPGTHVRGPDALYEDRRISDDEMEKYIPRKKWLNQTGPAGTTFLVDTTAYHKGLPLTEGERRVIVVYYTSSLFGQHLPLEPDFPRLTPKDFENNIQNYSPRFFQRLMLQQ